MNMLLIQKKCYMSKRLFIYILLSLCFVLMGAQTPIVINYSGSTANVNIPTGISDVTADVDGANVVINSATTINEYTYCVKGESVNGSLTISGNYKLKLQLAGVSLTNATGGPAINIDCGKRIAVELVEGTTNTLADVAGGTHKAALYFKGHPEFEGGGVLNVTGRSKHAISSKEYMELKSSTGMINILGAVGDGLHCGKGKMNNEHNYFLMKGGNVNILNVGSDGVDSDDYGCIRIEGGAISINVGDGATGLKADSLITIKDGDVNVYVKGTDSEGIRSRYSTCIEGGNIKIVVTGDGSKGIKSKRYAEESTVLNGGFVSVNGGNVEIETHGDDYVDETGDVSKCMGVSVDADYVQAGGNVTLYAMGQGAHTYNVKGDESLTGGELLQIKIPWKINKANYLYDMSAYVAVVEDAKSDINFGNIVIGAFVNGECVGYVLPSLCEVMRIYSNSENTGEFIEFRLYDYDTAIEYELLPQQGTSVSFVSMSCVGSLNSPVNLYVQYANFIEGVDMQKTIVQTADLYDISGRLIRKQSESFEGLSQGVYVLGGKKFVVK